MDSHRAGRAVVEEVSVYGMLEEASHHWEGIMKLHQPHQNLSDDINRNIQNMQIAGGVWVLSHGNHVVDEIKAQPVLPVGGVLTIQTRNTCYTLRKVSEDAPHYNFTIEGHPKYCLTPRPCHVHGSTWGGSMLRVGWIGRGMHLEMWIEGAGTITTSEIVEITEGDQA